MSICYHPCPSQNCEIDPAPCEMIQTLHGEYCPVCGYGYVTMSDDEHVQLLDESMRQYADIWWRLADA